MFQIQSPLLQPGQAKKSEDEEASEKAEKEKKKEKKKKMKKKDKKKKKNLPEKEALLLKLKATIFGP